MSCEKCGCGKKGGRLCPVSFGLAIGLTVGLAIFIWSVWVMYNGLTPMMAQYQIALPTWTTSITDALWGLLKGCLLYTSPSPRDGLLSRMPSSA